MYRMVDGLILELEPQQSSNSSHSSQFYHRLQGTLQSHRLNSQRGASSRQCSEISGG